MQYWNHPACLPDALLEKGISIRRTRASGPGGQHRNKVETAVVITHLDTGITASASERRSQHENRRVALQRLRRKLALNVRQPIESLESRVPSSLWQSRLSGKRVVISVQHADFPKLVAEVLDWLWGGQLDLPATARRLGCSTSQLVRLLKLDPAVLAVVNRARAEREMSPLR